MKTSRSKHVLLSLACLVNLLTWHPSSAEVLNKGLTGPAAILEAQAALAALDAELRQEPDNVPRRFMKAVTLSNLGRDMEALEIYAQLSRELPGAPEPLNNMAVLYARLGYLEEARNALTFALTKDPTFAQAHENLGDVHARMAEAAYETALKLAPGNASALPKLQLVAQSVRLPGDASIRTTGPFAFVMAKAATPPDPASPAAQPAAGVPSDKEVVESLIRAWAEAWSRRDAAGYLRHYTADYAPAGTTRAAWEALRRERIEGRASIQVQVSNLQVTVKGDEAYARFVQQYTAGNQRARNQKTMRLVKTADGWRIQSEATQ